MLVNLKKGKDSGVISRKNLTDNTVYMNKSMGTGARSAYTWVRGKMLIFDGEEYVRTLYGRIGSKEYIENYCFSFDNYGTMYGICFEC